MNGSIPTRQSASTTSGTTGARSRSACPAKRSRRSRPTPSRPPFAGMTESVRRQYAHRRPPDAFCITSRTHTVALCHFETHRRRVGIQGRAGHGQTGHFLKKERCPVRLSGTSAPIPRRTNSGHIRKCPKCPNVRGEPSLAEPSKLTTPQTSDHTSNVCNETRRWSHRSASANFLFFVTGASTPKPRHEGGTTGLQPVATLPITLALSTYWAR